MKDAIKLGIALFFPLLPWVTEAQVYLCKTANGQTISSDHVAPECADRAVREFGSNGMLKRDIPAPPTAAEKRQKQQEEEKRRLDIAAAEQQKKNDRAIIERYSTEADVEKARKRAIEAVQEQIKKRNMLISAAERQAKQANDEIAVYVRKKATPPLELRRKLEQAMQMGREEAGSITTHEAEIVHVNEKYDQTLKRFRELVGNAAAQ